MVVAKLPAMVCRSSIPDRPLAAGASIRRADPQVDIEAFRAVVLDGLASGADEVAAVDTVFSSPAALDMPDTVAVVASIDGRDTSAAMVNVIHRRRYPGRYRGGPSSSPRGHLAGN